MLEYTPQVTSDQLVKAATIIPPKTVVDFCAGRGSLLEAARRRWPTAKLFANDSDPKVMNSLPGANWVNLDFLGEHFDAFSPKTFPKEYDLVLLNPPFCFYRSQEFRPRGVYADVRCSVAFSFLFTALQYLSTDGELLAVMPTSTLKSERDDEARKILKKRYKCRLISSPSYDRFPGLDVSTYLLQVHSAKKRKSTAVVTNSLSSARVPWQITRGSVSVRRSKRQEYVGLHNWIHTTSISNSTIVTRYMLPDGFLARDQKFLPKTSLILPRVGKVRPGDLLVTSRSEILSDCLLGVTFDDPKLAYIILGGINTNYSSFSKLYAGTGAPYTTQNKVSKFIERLISQSQLRSPMKHSQK